MLTLTLSMLVAVGDAKAVPKRRPTLVCVPVGAMHASDFFDDGLTEWLVPYYVNGQAAGVRIFGPRARALGAVGLRVGDAVTGFNGARFDPSMFQRIVQGAEAGTLGPLSIDIVRSSARRTLLLVSKPLSPECAK